MRRSLWLAAAFAVISLQISSAASAQVAPLTFNWTGWYVGVEGGLASATTSQTNLNSGVSLGDFNQTGGLIGGTLGYNWQVTNWILGLETDFAWANIKGQETNCGLARNGTCPNEMRAFGTARARAGMPIFNNTIAFVAGGLAYADTHAYKEATNTTGGEAWRIGWTIGAGVEMMILPKWSLKVEYLYTTIPGTAATYTVVSNGNQVAAVERDIHMVRGGLNWHF